MSKYRIILDGKTFEMEIERIDSRSSTLQTTSTASVPAPKQIPVTKPQEKTVSAAVSAQPTGTAGLVKSPMPGTIVRILAAAGETVKKGEPVLVLEAMKMENEISSPIDGKVTAMYVAQGDTVQGGSSLFVIGE